MSAQALEAPGAAADPLLPAAIAALDQLRRPGVTGLQRRLKVSWNRAADLMDALQACGLVTAPDASGRRKRLHPTPANAASMLGTDALTQARRLRDGQPLGSCPQIVILELLQLIELEAIERAAVDQPRLERLEAIFAGEITDTELRNGTRALLAFGEFASTKAEPEAAVFAILEAARTGVVDPAVKAARERVAIRKGRPA